VGADLILTWAPWPRYDDNTSVEFHYYDAELRKFLPTGDHQRVVELLKQRANDLTVEACMTFIDQRGLDVEDVLADAEPRTEPTIAMHSGQAVHVLGGTDQVDQQDQEAAADAVRIRVCQAIDYIFTNPYNRGLTVLKPETRPFMFTGGMSHGDTPTDEYDYVLDLAVSGVTEEPVGERPA
jgi:hypothetical protein